MTGGATDGTADHVTEAMPGRPTDRAMASISSWLNAAWAVQSLAIGAVMALVALSYNIVYATLIYRGDLADAFPTGLGANLLATAIAGVLIAAVSPHRGALAGPQDTPAIVLAPAAGTIAAASGASASTVVALVMLTTVAIGATLWVMGALGLGGLLRYLPYPVVAGFLAGIGLVLIVSAFDLAIGADDTFDGRAVLRWVAAAVFGLVLLAVARRWPDRTLLTPALLVAAIVVVHGTRLLAGLGVDEAQDRGLLLGPFDGGSLWRPGDVWRFGDVDWSAVAGELTTVVPVLVLYPVALLLYLGAIDQQTGGQGDTNRSLRLNGLTNLLVAPTGASAVGTQMSASILAIRLGGANRTVPVVAALANGAVLFVGAASLALIPTVLVHGVTLFLGLVLVIEWLWDVRARLPEGEYLLVLAMAVITVVFDFFIGVAFGILVAVLLFVVRYSRTRSIRHQLTSRERRSNVQWGEQTAALLEQRGDRSMILELDGFLFFGSANRLVEPVVERLAADPPLEVVVVDFHRVVGVDSDAVTAFDTLLGLAEEQDFVVVFSALTPGDRERLRATRGRGWGDQVHFEPDLDRALEWCEIRLLGDDADLPNVDLGAWMADELGDRLRAERLLALWVRDTATAGSVLVRQGESSPGLIAVTSGVVSIYLDDRESAGDPAVNHAIDTGGRNGFRRRTLRPGALLGEISYYRGGAATATAVADTDVVFHRLTVDAVTRLEHDDPELALSLHRLLGRMLAERVTHSDGLIRAMLRPDGG